ncbi:hypothetical protein ACQP2X_13370 [Actinoplanes sp. CA-131856]
MTHSDGQILKTVAIMFSGGRDSSLAAVLYCLRGYQVQLLRFATGLGIPSTLPEVREGELRDRFGSQILPTPRPIPVHGLVRRIATAEIEDDFPRFDGKNLVLLGEKLAIHAASLAYCVRNGVRELADGSSGYQREMPEQREVALDFFGRLSAAYDVEYATPMTAFDSEMSVSYALLDAGISTKSLEGMSMFADSFSFADDDTVLRYLEAKRPIAARYLATFAAAGKSDA